MFEKNAEVVLCAMERRSPSHENCFRWPRHIHSSIYIIYNVRGALCLSRIVSMVSMVSMVYYVVPMYPRLSTSHSNDDYWNLQCKK